MIHFITYTSHQDLTLARPYTPPPPTPTKKLFSEDDSLLTSDEAMALLRKGCPSNRKIMDSGTKYTGQFWGGRCAFTSVPWCSYKVGRQVMQGCGRGVWARLR